MRFILCIHFFIISLISLSSPTTAQQPYARKATTDCQNTDKTTSVLGYTCNGVNTSCQSYLIFRSQPPYNSISSISTLLSANPLQISQINSVSESAIFATNQEVIVPINCSCSGEYYQFNTSYVIQQESTIFSIANNTFQGLSTCQAIQNQNKIIPTTLISGETLTIPIRCACPTKKQSDNGVNYLLSYIVTIGDFVSSISSRFGVSSTSLTLDANSLSNQDTNIYPFTTLLIPLRNPPSITNTIVPPPPPPPPRPPPPSGGPPGKGSKPNLVFVILGVLGGIALLVIIGTIVFCVFFRKSMREPNRNIESSNFESYSKPLSKEVEESKEFLDSLSSIAQSIKVYRYEELQLATDNFSPTSLIDGSVYRGKFNGDYAAIKKMNGDVTKEITLLNKINHFNLIRLSGICFNDGNWYLIYEYAPNGPLHDWIYTKNSDKKRLSWTQRVQISFDIATGLNYLHSYTVPPLIHKNINSTNILLDSDFRAKIASFGLARSAEGQNGHFALTRHIVGTKGYMAPEYLENGLISTKLDVYAFGVLMMEMITGKEVEKMYRENTIREVIGDEKLEEFIDPSLGRDYPLELAGLMVRLIDECLIMDASKRPSMDGIVQNLGRILNTSLNWDSSKIVTSMN